jgi:hypothetical protein
MLAGLGDEHLIIFVVMVLTATNTNSPLWGNNTNQSRIVCLIRLRSS